MTGPLRIGMWSGPRNISTAMMRAWENRPDCCVSDEPLYGAYLKDTGADHPAHDEVIASMETDWQTVADAMLGPPPEDRPIWYQKHMCHHLLPTMDIEWTAQLHNIFLIRKPEAVIASYLKARGTVSAEEIAFPRQFELFQFLSDRAGQPPPVIETDAFLADPEGHLRALCAHLEIPFEPAMLSWPPGPRETDGVWAPWWYESVHRSTGFRPPAPSDSPELDRPARRVADQCRPMYEAMDEHRIRY